MQLILGKAVIPFADAQNLDQQPSVAWCLTGDMARIPKIGINYFFSRSQKQFLKIVCFQVLKRAMLATIEIGPFNIEVQQCL